MKLSSDDQTALDALRAQTATTRRPTVPALEERLYLPVPCLDHGFVRIVDYMGDDGAVSRRPASPTARAPARSATTAGSSAT